MATATNKATTKAKATTTVTEASFEILDDAPTFRTAPGREKSPLRLAMEALPVGKSMTTGLTVSGENQPEDKNLIASVRQKAQEISKEAALTRMFSVQVDVQNRIIVTRNEGVPREAVEAVEADEASD
jgi:hypothetical protein